jgi:hypothetical protein
LSDPIRDLARLLDSAEISYALIGGHAVNVWVEPRFTADIDITIEAGVGQSERVKELLQGAGFEQDFVEGEEHTSGPDFIRFVSSDGRQVLELQAAKTDLQASLLERARPSEDGVRVATAEDLIVLKLIANRPKDRIDLLSLCQLPGLDWGYVEHWAERWEVSAVLERVRGELA